MRRRYKAKERERLIEAVKSSGEPVKVVAERMGVSVSAAYLWMKKARLVKAPEFARLVPATRTASNAVVVEVRGATIRLESGFDPDLLLAVVSVLDRLPS